MMKKALLIALLTVVFTVSAADNRVKNNFGFYFSSHDPVPGSFGLNLAWNITSFARVSGGMSGYSSGEGDFMEDEMESLMAGLLYIILLGMVDYGDIRDFYDIDSETVHKYVFSCAGGLNFFVPGWNLSPTVGIQFGKYISKNHPFGLLNKQSFVSYKLGLEWQSDPGLMLGVGYSYSPALYSKDLRNKFYVQLGWLF